MPAISFKSDVSFLEKLALGAAGAKATITRLKELGYEPIELERASTGYKIWKKIKIGILKCCVIFAHYIELN